MGSKSRSASVEVLAQSRKRLTAASLR